MAFYPEPVILYTVIVGLLTCKIFSHLWRSPYPSHITRQICNIFCDPKVGREPPVKNHCSESKYFEFFFIENKVNFVKLSVLHQTK